MNLDCPLIKWQKVVNDEVLNVVYIGVVDGYLLGSDCKTETLLFMLFLLLYCLSCLLLSLKMSTCFLF